ncbi:MAG: hypothetical protein Q8P02_04750 [Candidatus Micrarchaeota archaeon]|nr:hypothetical protein [Candidatus Micrarchaeota archaeon]
MPMNVLIVCDKAAKPLAESMAQGAKEVGATVTLLNVSANPDPKKFDFVFLGGKAGKTFSLTPYIQKTDWHDTKTAVFGAKQKNATLDAVVALLRQKQSDVQKNTFAASLKGPLALLGIGKFLEEDFIRARGFGERTLNTAFELRVQKSTDKQRISGYLK